MLEKYKTKLNRIISSVLALTMTASLFNAVPASAETLAGTSKTYLYDGYTVKYDVTNAWDDHSNVNLTITNTSDAPIKNWALKYDTDGDIENIWNGVVFNCDEEFSIIKNAGYNYEIAPDSSVTFGYTIVGADELPESIILSSQRKLFNADDYVVTLTVENDWDTGFIGNVEIKAVGDKPIEAWRLSFDTNFDLTSTWDAQIRSVDSNSFVIDNTYKNAFILPGESKSFGINGSKESGITPEINNIFISTVVVDESAEYEPVHDESSMEESLPECSSEADSSQLDTVSKAHESSLTETSSEPEESSEPESSSDPEVSSTELSSIIDSSENESSSVSDSSSSSDDSSKPDETTPSEDDIKTDVGQTNDLWVIAYGEYDAAENTIDILWYSNVEGEFQPFVSDDNEEYESLTDKTKYTALHYSIENNFDQKYFKVKVTKDDKCAYSIPFVAKRTNSGYVIEPLDSDEDGICDVTELKIGTDIEEPDTDKDGLSDFEEFTVTFTDPLDPNSVHPDLNDAQADRDGDGLSNADEIANITDPVDEDSDDDGLSDGDELNIYGTVPIDYDTDDDDINDGDEIALGFDPTSTDTNIKTTTIEQHIEKDNEVFAEINTEDNAFDISMDITAAGYAPTSLKAGASRYEAAVSNDAVVGVVPEFIYPDDLSIGEVTLNFDIKDSCVENTNGKYAAVSNDFKGIKRLCVFKYFDDIDMLLPIETTYDIENNTVSANVDELGTYCLIDIEKWFDKLEIDPNKFNTTTASPSVTGMVGGIPRNLILSAVPPIEDRCLDVVLNVYSSANSINKAPLQVFETGKMLFEEYGENADLHIYVVDYKGRTVNPKDTDRQYAVNIEELEYMCKNINSRVSGNEPYINEAIVAFLGKNKLRPEADKYLISIQHDVVTFTNNKLRQSFLDRLVKEEITACVVSNTNMTDTSVITDTTGGIYLSKNINDYSEPIVDYIIDFHKKKGEGTVYKTISAAGWKVIALEAPITEDYLSALRSGEDLSSYADQDNDGLRDLEELRYYFGDKQVINWDASGNVQLLTFEDCLNIYAAEPYVEHALSQYSGWDVSFMNNWRILPIKSDPTDPDSDDDYAPDGLEKELDIKPLCSDTDGDRLGDGKEIAICYDPAFSNADGDIFDDYDEFILELDPYTYDDDLGDQMADFIKGFLMGDFCEIESISQVMGQFVASLIPYVGKVCDIRDLAASIFHLDGKSFITNTFALIPGPGDLARGGEKISKFLLKHADDLPTVVKVVEKVTTKFPKIAKYIDIKTIERATDTASSTVKLTKRGVVQLNKAFKAAGKTAKLSEGVSKLMNYSQKVIEFSGKAEDFFDARDKNSGDDDDSEDSDEDRLTTAIKHSKHYKDFSSELIDLEIGTFYKYRDKYTEDVAVDLVKKTDYLTKNQVYAINICEDQLSVLRNYDLFGADFACILEKYSDDANDAVNAVSDKYKADAVTVIKNGEDEYGAEAVQAITTYGDDACSALAAVPSKKCAEVLLKSSNEVVNSVAKLDIESIKEYVQAVTDYGDDHIYLSINKCDNCDKTVDFIVRYADNYSTDLVELYGDIVVNSITCKDDIFPFEKNYIIEHKCYQDKWRAIDDYREDRDDLEVLGDYIPIQGDGQGTVAFIDLVNKKIFGINSSLLSNEEKDLGRNFYKKMKDSGYFPDTNNYGSGGSQVLIHGEGHALMQAYLNSPDDLIGKRITLYCDRKTCAICQTYLKDLVNYMNIKRLTIICKDGSVYRFS